jgi:hypothetical protein
MQKQKLSTFLRIRTKTFNLQDKKQKSSTFQRARTRTFNFKNKKQKPLISKLFK